MQSRKWLGPGSGDFHRSLGLAPEIASPHKSHFLEAPSFNKTTAERIWIESRARRGIRPAHASRNTNHLAALFQ